VIRLLLLLVLLLDLIVGSVGGGDLLLGVGGSSVFVFNGGRLVVLGRSGRCRLLTACDTAFLLLAFKSRSRWGARFTMTLSATLDTQGLGIGEFNLDILLLNAREFAVQLVGILDFLDIEARLEGAEGRETAEVGKVIASLARALVRGVVVEETEERGEFARGEAWEGKHCSDWGCLRGDFDDSVSLRELVGDAVGLHVTALLLLLSACFCF